MQRLYQVLASIMVVMLLYSCFATCAIMESKSVIPGQEDLSKLTYIDLLQLQNDISADYEAYHTPTDSQKSNVLSVTKDATQRYYAKKNIEITSWAWYDSEYTYTKDWDFYTLKTHLNYKDGNKKNKKVIIYAEIFNNNGRYNVSYLKADNTVILDSRSDYGDIVWFTEPKAKINEATNINLSKYTVQELKALENKVQKEYEKNHSVSKNEATVILSLTKSDFEQYCYKKNIEIKSYAWYDREYTYVRDWDYYWLETHVDYKTSSSSSTKTDQLYSEVCKINGNYELVFLKLGSTIIKDRRTELVIAKENGIPKYTWAAEKDSKKAENSLEEIPNVTPQIIYVTPEPETKMTPEIVYITPEPIPEITPEIIYITPTPNDGIFNVSLTELSDEQLAEAAEAIRAEQRARIKTHISLDKTEVILLVEKSHRIEATIIDLPNDERTPKLEWSTSDKKIATCSNNGLITAVSAGNAVITCGATLSDGTYIYEECKVKVNIPVSSITVDKDTVNLNGGEKYKPTFKFKPNNASNTELSFESSKPNVATVTSDGVIEGVGTGTAIITAKAVDGSKKSIEITVKVVDNRISEEKLKRILMFVTCNDRALDIFKADGNTIDKNKLHDYTYFSTMFKIIDEGKWTTLDGGNTWHVQNFLIQDKVYFGGYWQYSFDVRFDGTNYILDNGWCVHASELKWLDKSNPNRYGEYSLSNPNYDIYLIVSPNQIGE